MANGQRISNIVEIKAIVTFHLVKESFRIIKILILKLTFLQIRIWENNENYFLLL